MLLFDVGIALQIIGFIILILVSGRSPNSAFLLLESHKEWAFDTIRKRLVPDKYTDKLFYSAVIMVISGLVMQFSFLN